VTSLPVVPPKSKTRTTFDSSSNSGRSVLGPFLVRNFLLSRPAAIPAAGPTISLLACCGWGPKCTKMVFFLSIFALGFDKKWSGFLFWYLLVSRQVSLCVKKTFGNLFPLPELFPPAPKRHPPPSPLRVCDPVSSSPQPGSVLLGPLPDCRFRPFGVGF